MNKQADDEKNKPWMVRDVPERTRRLVKTYAASEGITVAEALERLVDKALDTASTAEGGSWSTQVLAAFQSAVEEVLKQHAASGEDISKIRLSIGTPETGEGKSE